MSKCLIHGYFRLFAGVRPRRLVAFGAVAELKKPRQRKYVGSSLSETAKLVPIFEISKDKNGSFEVDRRKGRLTDRAARIGRGGPQSHRLDVKLDSCTYRWERGRRLPS